MHEKAGNGNGNGADVSVELYKTALKIKISKIRKDVGGVFYATKRYCLLRNVMFTFVM